MVKKKKLRTKNLIKYHPKLKIFKIEKTYFKSFIELLELHEELNELIELRQMQDASAKDTLKYIDK